MAEGEIFEDDAAVEEALTAGNMKPQKRVAVAGKQMQLHWTSSRFLARMHFVSPVINM